MKRAIPALAAALLVLGTGTLASSQDSPPDTDFDLGARLFGNNEKCPEGELFRVGEWEDFEQRLQRIQADAPEDVDLGEAPPIDYFWIIPNDVAQFVDAVPQGTRFIVSCALVAPDDLRLVDPDGVFVAEAPEVDANE
jgi:hypothetical protein